MSFLSSQIHAQICKLSLSLLIPERNRNKISTEIFVLFPQLIDEESSPPTKPSLAFPLVFCSFGSICTHVFKVNYISENQCTMNEQING